MINETRWEIYSGKIVELVKKLHSLGIYHSDITEENIVVNPTTKDVKIIDFGLSEWIEDLKAEFIVRFYEGVARSVPEAIDCEVNEVLWLMEQKP